MHDMLAGPHYPRVQLHAPDTAAAAGLADALVALGCALQRPPPDTAAVGLPPQVLLLDGPAALPLLQRLRRTAAVPALVLVPQASALERVIALEAGADDAMAHPVDPRELLARLRALCRRAPVRTAAARELCFGGWRLDRLTRVLHTASGQKVPLSQAECRLLEAFLQNPGSVLAREQLMDLARGRAMHSFERSIDLLVSRLRAKLQDDPRAPRHIRTVRGVGYLFDALGVDARLEGAAPAMLLDRYQADKPA